MNINVSDTKVLERTMSAYSQGQRLIANRGGTRSGKTYSVVTFIVLLAVSSRVGLAVDIVSESFPHLKRGAMKDFQDICDNWGLVEDVHFVVNRSDHIYTFSSGVVIRFFSADDWGKVKGSRRDILFINEANRIPWETYRQLSVRTTQTIFIDWNPDSEFWFEEQQLNIRDTTTEIVSTYLDNPFLGAEQVAEIESNKDDENWWKVYGLGLVGRPQGLIYTRWEQCNEIPAGAKLIARGLDFGFTNDPTAIIAVYMSGGELWLDEECYLQNLTNDKIADRLRGVSGSVVADSAEMKSITEIHNYGVRNIEPAIKGADSVRNGIQILQRYNIHVTSRSLNTIKELRNYKWQEDRITGEQKNVPVDKYNHALDAVRYVAQNKLSRRRVGTAKAHVNKLD